MNPGKKPKKKRKNPVASSKPKRDKHGRFKSKARAKRRLKKKAAKSRGRRMRTKAVIKVMANPPRRRRKRKLAANPAPMRRRKKRKLAANPPVARRRRRRAAAKVRHAAKRRAAPKRRRNPLSKGFRRRVASTIKKIRTRSRKAPKRSLRRRAMSAQLKRASAIASLAASRAPAKRIRPAIRGLQKAMLIRNPSVAGVMAAVRVLAVPAVVTTVSLAGSALAGKKLADMLLFDEKGVIKEGYADKDGKLTAPAKYAPAAITAVISGLAFIAANAMAPKHRGAIFIGGMTGAMLQALFAPETAAEAAPLAKDAKLLDSVKRSFGVGEYTTVGSGIFHGVGEYTTVGSGIFHGVGEYTTVGGGADNATEFAADSLRGLDDASQFAPGEGGVLSGGIFK